jgi:hypothetical protein
MLWLRLSKEGRPSAPGTSIHGPSERNRSGLVLGSWRFVHGESTLVDQSKPDSPVATEFRHVVDCADQYGIPFVWVNDPEELFPPWERR